MEMCVCVWVWVCGCGCVLVYVGVCVCRAKYNNCHAAHAVRVKDPKRNFQERYEHLLRVDTSPLAGKRGLP
jgi:hypothetical protein